MTRGCVMTAETIARALGGRRAGQGWTARCPAHDDTTPSLSVADRNGRVLAHCHAGCSQERVLAALEARGLDIRLLRGDTPGHVDVEDYRHSGLGKPSRLWPYHDDRGHLVGYVARFEPKTFRPLVLDGGQWRTKGFPKPYPLFNLPGILSRAGATVLVCEGEKTAEAASTLFPDMVATTPMHGAKSPAKTDWGPVQGRAVTVWPDADEAGAGFAVAVAQLARETGAASVRTVKLPDTLPKSWDLSDEAPPGLDLDILLAGASEPDEPKTGAGGAPVLTCLADVTPEPVTWLWRGRVPLGKLTILDGDPDLGKSLISLDLAARVSKGDSMPDGQPGLHEPAGVVLLTCEDDLGDTVRPRLDTAGADVARIVHLTYVRGAEGETLPTIAHIAALSQAIEEVGAQLIVIDPFMAYIPAKTNSHRDQDIRGALAPLAELAARTRAAFLIVRHLNKAPGGNPLYRGGGSIGIIGAVRSGLLVAPDPGDDEQRVLAVSKANLSKKPESLTYHVAVADEVPFVAWGKASEHTAATLLASSGDDGEKRSAVADAADFLRDVLAAGPVPTEAVKQQSRDAGIAWATVRRAKEGLVKPKKPGGPGTPWYWALIKDAEGSAKGAQPDNDEHLKLTACKNTIYCNDLAKGAQAAGVEHLKASDEHLTDADLLDEYEERAAIMEYDGGLTRGEAELRAAPVARGPLSAAISWDAGSVVGSAERHQ